MTKQEEFKQKCLDFTPYTITITDEFGNEGYILMSEQIINLRGTDVVISNLCRKTKEPLTQENFDIAIGYWYPNLWYGIQKDHKKEYMQTEAYECQKIDTNCNDCKYLDRKENSCKLLFKTLNFGANTCMPENQYCFIHRKD